MTPIKVLIVDDCPVVRDALASILRPQPGILVVGEAKDGLEGAAIAESLRPDVVLMDLQLPGVNGAEATRRAKQRLPHTKILCLMVHPSDISAALAAGADAFLMKDAGRGELSRKIRDMVRRSDLPAE